MLGIDLYISIPNDYRLEIKLGKLDYHSWFHPPFGHVQQLPEWRAA